MSAAAFNPAKNSSGKILPLVSLALALISCASAVYLYAQWSGLAREKKNFEAARVQLQDQVNALKQEAESAAKEKMDLNQKLSAALKGKVEQLQAAETVRAQAARLQTDLDSATKELADLKKKMEKPAPVEAPAAAAPEAVAAAEHPASEPGVMKIKTINRKFNFVVLGTVSGKTLSPGDALRVERDGRWVADLSVQKTYDQFASAAIKKESEKDPIRTGDTVQ